MELKEVLKQIEEGKLPSDINIKIGMLIINIKDLKEKPFKNVIKMDDKVEVL